MNHYRQCRMHRALFAAGSGYLVEQTGRPLDRGEGASNMRYRKGFLGAGQVVTERDWLVRELAQVSG